MGVVVGDGEVGKWAGTVENEARFLGIWVR